MPWAWNMHLHFIFLLAPLVLSIAHPRSHARDLPCKSVPGSLNWPSADEWSQLNDDLGGRLLRPSPPALVCDPSRTSTYDQAQCAFVGGQWHNELFHTGDPVSVHYPNWQCDGCLPTALNGANAHCDVTPFPTYVVNATSANDVAMAVQFAAEKNVRLSVKGTGHDFLGRSSKPGLSIWTHNIRGISFLSSFTPSGYSGGDGVPAVQVAAGHTNADVYTEAKKNGVIPVIGMAPGVGIGGYLTGGGHSPIGVKYGLGVDNVLEMVVVTPAGQVVTANDYQNQDLFWAMKGGGGATFGVLISATLKTYPVFPITNFLIKFASTSVETVQNNNSNFFTTLALFHSLITNLTDNYLTGYYSIRPLPSGSIGPPRLSFGITGWGISKSPKDVNRLLSPLRAALAAQSNLTSSIVVKPPKSIYAKMPLVVSPSGVADYAAGYNRVVGSRLWDKAAVTDTAGLIKTFQSLDPLLVQGNMIAGAGVRDVAKIKNTSVTPAWRNTYTHLILITSYDYNNKTQEDATVSATTRNTAILRRQAPNTGCYSNEADVNEPNYQQAFWGSNYARLLDIKRRIDPQGVFWCPVCVGAEDWTLDPSTGEVCSASNRK